MRKAIYIFVGLCILWSPAAFALSRHALIIGNDKYPMVPLKNARNDARAVDEAFKGLGYDTTLLLDVDRARLEKGVDTFVGHISDGDVAVVYYAGHGMQVEGENYLIPTDFSADNKRDGVLQGYSLSELLQKVQAHGASTQIVILDACRDNPFPGTRSLHGGWAGLATSAGSFLAFGTSPGSTAADAPNASHGAFTASLLKYISTSNLDVEQMFQQVRQDVIASSDGKQVPWTASSLIGTLHIIPALDEKALPLATDLVASAPSEERSRGDADPGRGISAIDAAPPATSAAPEVEMNFREDGSRGAAPAAPQPVSVSKGGAAAPSQDPSALLATSIQQIQGYQYEEAQRGLTALMSLTPQTEIAAQLLGFVLHYLGSDHKAVPILTRSIAQDSSSADLLYARCIVGANVDPKLAVEDCLRVLSLAPATQDGHNALAQAYLAIGAYTKAASELKLASASTSETPSITQLLQRTLTLLAQGANKR